MNRQATMGTMDQQYSSLQESKNCLKMVLAYGRRSWISASLQYLALKEDGIRIDFGNLPFKPSSSSIK